MPETPSLSSYLDSYGHTLALVEYLARELSSHPQLKEIPLLGETNGLTISNSVAWEIILSYLRENNLSSQYLELLENPSLAKQKKLEVILDFLHNKETELPLANLAIENNLLAYQTSLKLKSEALDPSSPLQKAFAIQHEQIKKYHESLHNLQVVAFSSTTIQRTNLEALLPPPEILSDTELKYVQEQLVSLLPSLATASELASTPKPETIYKALSSFASKNAALSKFVVFNSSDEQKARLTTFVDSIATAYTQKTGQSLIKLEEDQRNIASNNLSSFALPRLEAERVIVNILTARGLMPTKDASSFASQLFTESVRSAYTSNSQVTPNDLVTAALTKFSIAPNSAEARALSEAISPIFSDLLVHNQTQIIEARQHGIVPGPIRLPQLFLPTEVKLALSTHTDPTLLTTNSEASLNTLLKQYGVTDLAVLRSQAQRQNNLPLLTQLSILDNHQAQLSRLNTSLTPIQQLSVGFIKTKHAFGRGLTSYHQITNQAWDNLFKFQEKLDHFNPIARATNWWVDTEAKLMDTRWGWLVNPLGKAVQVFDSFREKIVTNLLKKYKLSPPKNMGGRFVNWAAKMYYQGNFTLSGFATQATHWVASKAYLLAKSGAKKLGAFIIKKVTGLAIKILGEAAVKQIAGSVLPVIGNIIAAIATIVDLIKNLWQNREVILDLVKKGAVYVAAIGYALWTFLAALLAKFGSALLGSIMGATIGFFVGGPVGAIVGGVIGGAVGFLATNIAAAVASVASYASAMMSALAAAGAQIAILGAGIIGITFLSTLTIITAMTTAEIPTNITNAIISIVCNQSSESSANPTANVALCIYELVNKCPELNPVTEPKLTTPSWQCLVGGLVFQSAISELEVSTYVKNNDSSPYGNLQCVGLSAAAASGGGGAFSTGQINACQYAHNLPNGYQYLPGCPNMQAGDHFIMGADDCNGYGGDGVGHIGVVIDPSGGEKFTCVDANYFIPPWHPGEVRGPDSCYFAKSQISGCLRKI